VSEEQKTWTYKVEDIFEDIPEDPENVIMKFPPEICDQMGLVPGDNLKILWGDQGTIIIQKLDKEEIHGKE
jgi:hypothetical protein